MFWLGIGAAIFVVGAISGAFLHYKYTDSAWQASKWWQLQAALDKVKEFADREIQNLAKITDLERSLAQKLDNSQISSTAFNEMHATCKRWRDEANKKGQELSALLSEQLKTTNAHKAKATTFEASTANLEGIISQQLEHNEALESQKRSLKEDLTLKTREIGALAKLNFDSASRLETLQSHYTRVTSLHRSLKSENSRLARSQPEAFRKLEDDLQKASSELQKSRKELTKCKSSLSTATMTNELLDVEQEDHRAQVDKAAAKAVEQAAEISRLNQASSELRKVGDDCQNEKRKQGADFADLKTAFNNLVAVHFKCSSVEDNQKLQDESRSTKETLADTKRQLQDLQEIHKKCKTSEVDEEMAEAVEPEDDEIDAMAVDDPNQMTITSLRSDLHQLRESNTTLNRLLASEQEAARNYGANQRATIRRDLEMELRADIGQQYSTNSSAVQTELRVKSGELDAIRKSIQNGTAFEKYQKKTSLQDDLARRELEKRERNLDAREKKLQQKQRNDEERTEQMRQQQKQSGGHTTPQDGAAREISQLKLTLKGVRRQLKNAKERNESQDQTINRNDPRVAVEYRDADRIREEMGQEILGLERRVADLEREVEAPPSSNPVDAATQTATSVDDSAQTASSDSPATENATGKRDREEDENEEDDANKRARTDTATAALSTLRIQHQIQQDEQTAHGAFEHEMELRDARDGKKREPREEDEREQE